MKYSCFPRIRTVSFASLLTIAFIFIFLVLPTPFSALAAEPGEEWNRTFGGRYGDGAWCLQETEDGGCIMVGNSAARGEGSDLFLVRADALGNSLWSRIIGGSGEDVGYFVQETKDGGYIITGSTYSYGAGESDLYLVKTDAKGHVIWERFYGGPYVEWGNSVVQTRDRGYVVAGYRFPDAGNYDEAYIVKTDGNGDLLWEKAVGGSNADRFHAVAETSDGGLVFTGYLHSQGGLSGPTCLESPSKHVARMSFDVGAVTNQRVLS